MGKTRTSFKNEVREKVPLDQQITAGKVARGKSKFKLRLRAEEEDVSSISFKKKTNNHFCSKLTNLWCFTVRRCTLNAKNPASGPGSTS